jgi:hypothetical protein
LGTSGGILLRNAAGRRRWLAKMNQRGNEAWSHWQRLFPLVDEAGRLRGVLTLRWLFDRQHRVERAIEGTGETREERSGFEEAHVKIEIGLD